jgi:hypothetical protein
MDAAETAASQADTQQAQAPRQRDSDPLTLDEVFSLVELLSPYSQAFREPTRVAALSELVQAIVDKQPQDLDKLIALLEGKSPGSVLLTVDDEIELLTRLDQDLEDRDAFEIMQTAFALGLVQ